MNEQDDLVTVAAFNDVATAHIARNELEALGIRAFVTDDEIVSMAWFFSGAVGGVKLQVLKPDVEEARAILAECRPAAEQREDQPSKLRDELDDEEPALTSREDNADRALRGAILGILFIPLQLYVFWLLLKVFVSEDSLAAPNRRRALIAAAINLPMMLLLCVLLRLMLT